MASLNELLDLQKIREWVKGKPEKHSVGSVGIPQSCPIAQYLKEEGGYIGAYVIGKITVWYDEDLTEDVTAPPEIRSIIGAVDRYAPLSMLSRESFLGILDDVEAQYAKSE